MLSHNIKARASCVILVIAVHVIPILLSGNTILFGLEQISPDQAASLQLGSTHHPIGAWSPS
jgi:hypothetical protein